MAVAAASLGGCDSVFKGGPATSASATESWPFAPVAMRIHPFTSVVSDPQHRTMVLEIHMEMLDPQGDVTKGVGHFRFELYEAKEKSARTDEDVRLYMWDAPMETPEQNQQHYDPSTRTYVFKLKLEQPPTAGQKFRIAAQLTDPSGKRLIASAPLKYSGVKPEPGTQPDSPSK